jgi:F-type H+-transporting ATPase subunit gamma
MPSLKVIRRRIVSVKNTQKITRAMKMVAAARLRRAQQRITELRPYARKTIDVLRSVSRGGGDGAAHPLLAARPVKKVLLVVCTSDRGLAGAFNSGMIRASTAKLKELADGGFDVSLCCIGRKGRDFFKRRDAKIAMEYTGLPEGNAQKASEIARAFMHAFTSDEYDQVILGYAEFKSAISQKPVFQQVLPIEAVGGDTATDESPSSAKTLVDFIYEPSREALLERLLPMYVEVSVFRALLESSASEHGARMTAMDNATTNAKKMINSLTLQYNRARQAAITKELMEIIGGAEAIKD